MSKQRTLTLDYQRRLKARLARQDEDAGYAELRQAVRPFVAMEAGDYPYDQETLYDLSRAINLAPPPPAGTLYGWSVKA